MRVSKILLCATATLLLNSSQVFGSGLSPEEAMVLECYGSRPNYRVEEILFSTIISNKPALMVKSPINIARAEINSNLADTIRICGSTFDAKYQGENGLSVLNFFSKKVDLGKLQTVAVKDLLNVCDYLNGKESVLGEEPVEIRLGNRQDLTKIIKDASPNAVWTGMSGFNGAVSIENNLLTYTGSKLGNDVITYLSGKDGSYSWKYMPLRILPNLDIIGVDHKDNFAITLPEGSDKKATLLALDDKKYKITFKVEAEQGMQDRVVIDGPSFNYKPINPYWSGTETMTLVATDDANPPASLSKQVKVTVEPLGFWGGVYKATRDPVWGFWKALYQLGII